MTESVPTSDLTISKHRLYQHHKQQTMGEIWTDERGQTHLELNLPWIDLSQHHLHGELTFQIDPPLVRTDARTLYDGDNPKPAGVFKLSQDGEEMTLRLTDTARGTAKTYALKRPPPGEYRELIFSGRSVGESRVCDGPQGRWLQITMTSSLKAGVTLVHHHPDFTVPLPTIGVPIMDRQGVALGRVQRHVPYGLKIVFGARGAAQHAVLSILKPADQPTPRRGVVVLPDPEPTLPALRPVLNAAALDWQNLAQKPVWTGRTERLISAPGVTLQTQLPELREQEKQLLLQLAQRPAKTTPDEQPAQTAKAGKPAQSASTAPKQASPAQKSATPAQKSATPAQKSATPAPKSATPAQHRQSQTRPTKKKNR